MNTFSSMKQLLSEQASETEEFGWCRLLAGAFALSTLELAAHWKTKGSNYYGDHLLFERLYKDTSGEVDGLAEKAIGTTGDDSFISAYRLLQEAADCASKWDFDEVSDAESFTQVLLRAEQDFIEIINSVYLKFESRGYLTGGVSNLLEGMIDKHEEHVYLLGQRTK